MNDPSGVRNLFAAAALIGLVAKGNHTTDGDCSCICEAFRLADLMVAEATKEEEAPDDSTPLAPVEPAAV